MKFEWDKEKNDKLKIQRGISFEEIIDFLKEEENVLDIIAHPNKKRYPNQQMYILKISDYAYVVPFVDDENKRFLKTIIPSRKMTQKYLRGGEEK